MQRATTTAPKAGPRPQRLPVVTVTRLRAGQTTAQPATTRAEPETRLRPLIAERPLTTNTGTGLPEPLPHMATRPVVRPRWSGTPAASTGPQQTPSSTGSPSRPAVRSVHVQRHTGHQRTATAVVRPTPPQPLDHAPKLPSIAHPHPSGTPTTPDRDRTATAPAAAPRPTAGNVPVKWPSTTTVQRTSTATKTTKTTPARTDPPTPERGDDGKPQLPFDLDDLARRLLDPVVRLLRAELREGRERNGRLHDRRR